MARKHGAAVRRRDRRRRREALGTETPGRRGQGGAIGGSRTLADLFEPPEQPQPEGSERSS